MPGLLEVHMFSSLMEAMPSRSEGLACSPVRLQAGQAWTTVTGNGLETSQVTDNRPVRDYCCLTASENIGALTSLDYAEQHTTPAHR
jgi:hypothetical protein